MAVPFHGCQWVLALLVAAAGLWLPTSGWTARCSAGRWPAGARSPRTGASGRLGAAGGGWIHEAPLPALTGQVERLVFKATNGYTVVKLRSWSQYLDGGDSEGSAGAVAELHPEEDRPRTPRKSGPLVTAVAPHCLAAVEVGDVVQCQGRYEESPKWGRQFQVQEAQILGMEAFSPGGPGTPGAAEDAAAVGSGGTPHLSTEGLLHWLGSGAIKGVGPAFARKIIDHFGDETAAVLDELTEDDVDLSKVRLHQVPGVGQRKVDSIARQLQSMGVHRSDVQELCTLGVPLELASRVIDYWGERAKEMILGDCHETLLEADATVSFPAADEVAMKLGTALDAAGRLRHGTRHCTALLTARDGHCCIPVAELVPYVSRFLGVPNHSTVATAIQDMALRGELSIETLDGATVVFPEVLFEAELSIAKAIASRCRATPGDSTASSKPDAHAPQSQGSIEDLMLARKDLELLESTYERRRSEWMSSAVNGAHRTSLRTAIITLRQQIQITHRNIQQLLAADVTAEATLPEVPRASSLSTQHAAARWVDLPNVLSARRQGPVELPRGLEFDDEFEDVEEAALLNDWEEDEERVVQGDGEESTYIMSREQRRAVRRSLRDDVVLLSGGPGVGKTTTVRQIVRELLIEGDRVGLCCPTARAAQVLSAIAEHPASTIHRLLQWNVHEAEFQHNSENPLPLDVVVVDEASMLDTELAGHLLAALSPSARLLLVGDPDQLPSVGPGAVFADLLAAKRVPRVVLSRIFRQQGGGDGAWGAEAISDNAHLINSGHSPSVYRSELFPSGGQELVPGFVFMEADGSREVGDQVVDVVNSLVSAKVDPGDIQVLSPIKRGAAGTVALNQCLQRLLNPKAKEDSDSTGSTGGVSDLREERDHLDAGEGKPQRASRVFEGDRVMQLVNDYDRGVFNGDIGVVRRVLRNGTFVVDFGGSGTPGPTLPFRPSELDQRVSLSYALTVHKSQGSEYPVVVLSLAADCGRQMLQRTLLYTAVSRAKQLLVLVSSKPAVEQCVSNSNTRKRLTRLTKRIDELNEKHR